MLQWSHLKYIAYTQRQYRRPHHLIDHRCRVDIWRFEFHVVE